jgi:hypothetical protein
MLHAPYLIDTIFSLTARLLADIALSHTELIDGSESDPARGVHVGVVHNIPLRATRLHAGARPLLVILGHLITLLALLHHELHVQREANGDR